MHRPSPNYSSNSNELKEALSDLKTAVEESALVSQELKKALEGLNSHIKELREELSEEKS